MSQLENAPVDVESNDESEADKAEAGASLLSDLATSSSSSDD